MTDRTGALRVAVDAEDGLTPLARFLIWELESSDDINGLLALFDGPEQSVASRLAGRMVANRLRIKGGS